MKRQIFSLILPLTFLAAAQATPPPPEMDPNLRIFEGHVPSNVQAAPMMDYYESMKLPKNFEFKILYKIEDKRIKNNPNDVGTVVDCASPKSGPSLLENGNGKRMVTVDSETIEKHQNEVKLTDGRRIVFTTVPAKGKRPAALRYTVLKPAPRGELVEKEGPISFRGTESIAGLSCSHKTWGDVAADTPPSVLGKYLEEKALRQQEELHGESIRQMSDEEVNSYRGKVFRNLVDPAGLSTK